MFASCFSPHVLPSHRCALTLPHSLLFSRCYPGSLLPTFGSLVLHLGRQLPLLLRPGAAAARRRAAAARRVPGHDRGPAQRREKRSAQPPLPDLPRDTPKEKTKSTFLSKTYGGWWLYGRCLFFLRGAKRFFLAGLALDQGARRLLVLPLEGRGRLGAALVASPRHSRRRRLPQRAAFSLF